jgi:hypothetical protein
VPATGNRHARSVRTRLQTTLRTAHVSKRAPLSAASSAERTLPVRPAPPPRCEWRPEKSPPGPVPESKRRARGQPMARQAAKPKESPSSPGHTVSWPPGPPPGIASSPHGPDVQSSGPGPTPHQRSPPPLLLTSPRGLPPVHRKSIHNSLKTNHDKTGHTKNPPARQPPWRNPRSLPMFWREGRWQSKAAPAVQRYMKILDPGFCGPLALTRALPAHPPAPSRNPVRPAVHPPEWSRV